MMMTDKKIMRAGVASADISPVPGIELAGYPHCPRHNTGVHDPLYAAALYLDDGETRLALVTLDLLFYSKKYVAEVRRRITASTGIPGGNVMIGCSHTHSGPWAAGRLDLEALEQGLTSDPEYVRTLNDTIVATVEKAVASAFQARIGTGGGTCGAAQGVGGNRRDPAGPADPEVCVIGVSDAATGEMRGAWICYALHPTVIHAESTVVTADYPAYIRKYLKWAKPRMTMLFAQGTSGDQSTRYFRDGQSFEEAARIGTTIGVEAGRVLDGLKMSEHMPLRVLSAEVGLPLREFPDRATAEENVRRTTEEFRRLSGAGAPYIDVRNAELKVFGAEDILGYILLGEKGIKPELLADDLPLEVQVIGIGDTRVVGLQGEAFVGIGLALKQTSSSRLTFVCELSNGAAPGYIYTRESLAEGGYETDTSMLGPECAEIIIKTTEKLLEEMS